MARPRTPTNILRLRGSFKKHPERRRTDPQPTGELGPPPEHLSEVEVQCWRELERHSAPGVLTAADRFILEIASKLMAEFRELGREFRSARLARLQGALGCLGLTPADRSRLGLASTKEDEASAWDL